MDGFKNLFVGSNCNPDQTTEYVNNNAFRSFMNNIIVAPQQLGSYDKVDISQNLHLLMNKMDAAWKYEQEQYYVNYSSEQIDMQSSWQKIQILEEKSRKLNTIIHQPPTFDRWYTIYSTLPYTIKNLSSGFDPLLSKQPPKLIDQKVEEDKEGINNPRYLISGTTLEQLELMMNDPDPRFQQSEFLKLAKTLNAGKQIKKDDAILDCRIKIDEFDLDDQDCNFFNDLQIDTQFKEYIQQADGEFFNCQELDHPDSVSTCFTANHSYIKWNDIIGDIAKNGQFEQYVDNILLEDAKRNITSEISQHKSEVYSETPYKKEKDYFRLVDNYEFNVSNPYLNTVEPLELLAEILELGDLTKIVLILEAYLTTNSTDYKAWKCLGAIYLDMNEDYKSVCCLLTALKYNKSNKDIFFQLGTSCASVLDEIHALSFLERWLHNNPFYKNYVAVLPRHDFLIPEDKLRSNSWKLEDIGNLSSLLLEKFLIIKDHSKTNDPELNTCIAVINFNLKDYKTALKYYEYVLDKDPTNYSVWNCMGLAYSLLDLNERVRLCYSRALDLKPNYIKGWCNLATYYRSSNKYIESSALLLDALSLNPKSHQIWGSFKSTMKNNPQFGISYHTNEQDLNNFSHLHNVHSFAELPEPCGLNYTQMFEKYVLKGSINNWIAESKTSTHNKSTKFNR